MSGGGEGPIVEVREGKLQGRLCENLTGGEFYSFQGVPYAKPPLGELRFKPPLSAEKWRGIRDATKEGPGCYSRNILTNIMGGSEDCLQLNVYTPKINVKQLLPVMFWIHGGGFVAGSGSSDQFGPDYLVEKNVVLVTINYRLGPLGFLAFPDPSVGVTGNAGLKDIVLALKWVGTNIKQFGGNPENVIIFGESAGAVAVHLLILSPMSKGLFHKAIMQSGCALSCICKGRCSSTYEIAHNLGIQSNNDKAILKELQGITVEKLLKASDQIFDPFLVSHLRPFSPVIEPNTSPSAFLTEEPQDIIKSGRYNKVPIIIGYNSLEGAFIHGFLRAKPKYFLTDATLVPHTLNLRIGSEQFNSVAQKIRNQYGITGMESIKVEADMEKALNVYSHNYASMDIYMTAKLHRPKNKFPIYFYKFDLDTKLNFMKILGRIKAKGAGHADDLAYLFTTILVVPPEPDSLEYNLIQKITTMWTNFAKFGRPSDEWKAISPKEICYMSMEIDGFKMLVDPDREAMEFWERIYRDYQRMCLSKL